MAHSRELLSKKCDVLSQQNIGRLAQTLANVFWSFGTGIALTAASEGESQ
jgi:hypothetical protein